MLDVMKQMNVENEGPEGVMPAAPAWLEGANFDVIRSKLRQPRLAIIWPAVLGAVICAVLVAIYIAHRTPTYSASSRILIVNTTLQISGPDAVVTQLLTENSLIQSEMELVGSDEVLKRVIDGLGAAEVEVMLRTGKWLEPNAEARHEAMLARLRANINASRIGATQIIAVGAKAMTAKGAARLANEVANAFVRDQNETNALITTNAWLRERIKVLGPTLRVISTAVVPGRPDGPNPFNILALSILTGAILGAGAGIVFALLDRRLVSAEQIALITPAECFGYVPRLGAPHGRGDAPAGDAPPLGRQLSRLNDVLRCARLAALQRAGGGIPLVGVTSCQQREGKSMIAMHLAKLIAAEGRRVLLIDAARDPKLTRYLAADVREGLKEVLTGEASASEAIWPDIEPFLDFMPAGVARNDIDTRWIELPHLLAKLGQRATDWVVLDLPALAPIADVRAAAQGLNGILLIVEWGRTGERRLREALRALGPARAKLLGVIVNRSPRHAFEEIAVGFAFRRGVGALQAAARKLWGVGIRPFLKGAGQ
jgi:Mrp family chromosome partitioning ATPase/capsular polysaccharide biosynthesis protein